jgi:hypothetical protein
MSDLYNDNRSSTISGVNWATMLLNLMEIKNSEKWFQEFREFDYGIDIKRKHNFNSR